MEDLILLGRNDDNTALLLATDEGMEFSLPIDDSLRRELLAATSPKPTHAQDSGSALTPREIQARIRRGDSAAQIAHTESVSEEWVAKYAGPVLAERAHMARRASETFLRRNGVEEMLVSLVERQLSANNVDVFELTWDAWRRDDSRWNLTVAWPSGIGQGIATWIFDATTLSIVALDDSARWLFDESTAQPSSVGDEPVRPRLVGIPTRDETLIEDDSYEEPTGLDVPAWAAPSQPTIPVVIPTSDSPSWDDILFGSRPTE